VLPPVKRPSSQRVSVLYAGAFEHVRVMMANRTQRASGVASLTREEFPNHQAVSFRAVLRGERPSKALHDNYLPVLWISRGALARGFRAPTVG